MLTKHKDLWNVTKTSWEQAKKNIQISKFSAKLRIT